MNTYKTSEVAKIIGIHPNTVRFYEKWGLIPKAERKSNGYRVFTDFHIEQLRLARIAFKTEVLQSGLRKKIVETVKVSASGDFDKALILASEYLSQIHDEQKKAEEAIDIAKQVLGGKAAANNLCLKRKEVSEHLNISMDTLRNWELNGLLRIKRKQNGYRFYTGEDVKRLKIIRTLRCANYSLEAILRMLNALSDNPQANIKQVLNTPKDDTDIISACDRLIVSLQIAAKNAEIMVDILMDIKRRFS
ncbi:MULTISPECIES: MerR family transcriptional regulator [unclassified Sedimentibacter]|uniref:MerR family transcriptional regulator n=1 Tax=unclassified Sedimentibacter TaxID=2649220 RepID=UPI0027E1F997|nr:MerR family transcriptional regulator [Sedimentibacter sp. MB35-C1]WMJ78186.1 MerR family transcriptional regulator [Sedimentibacter sp. MB35-C1]